MLSLSGTKRDFTSLQFRSFQAAILKGDPWMKSRFAFAKLLNYALKLKAHLSRTSNSSEFNASLLRHEPKSARYWRRTDRGFKQRWFRGRSDEGQPPHSSH